MTRRPRGPLPDWRPSTERQKGILADLIARYTQHHTEGTLPRGGRGIFYDLRPHGMGHGITYRKPDSAHPISGYGPMEAHPAAVQEVLALARRAGMIPEDWVADARAPQPLRTFYDESADQVVETVAGIVSGAAARFRLDPQRDQPVFVETLIESEDLAPRALRIAGAFGVPVYPSGGFDGLKGKRALAARAAGRGVPTVVLHLGDFDVHGRYIFTAAAEDAAAWLPHYGAPDVPGDWLTFRRIALTREQAEAHNLLDADGKAELDGLPVPVLDAIITDAIAGLQDPVVRRLSLDEQERERERIPAALRERIAS
jgi:hypothetical protein